MVDEPDRRPDGATCRYRGRGRMAGGGHLRTLKQVAVGTGRGRHTFSAAAVYSGLMPHRHSRRRPAPRRELPLVRTRVEYPIRGTRGHIRGHAFTNRFRTHDAGALRTVLHAKESRANWSSLESSRPPPGCDPCSHCTTTQKPIHAARLTKTTPQDQHESSMRRPESLFHEHGAADGHDHEQTPTRLETRWKTGYSSATESHAIAATRHQHDDVGIRSGSGTP